MKSSKKKTSKLKTYCKSCGKAFTKTNPSQKYCSVECSSKGAMRIRRRATLLALTLEKGGKCSICEYNNNLAALNFHHIFSQDKKFSLNCNTIMSHSKKAIIEEAKKCILVCSNCHAEIHHRDLGIKELLSDKILFERIKTIQETTKLC